MDIRRLRGITDVAFGGEFDSHPTPVPGGVRAHGHRPGLDGRIANVF